MKNALELMNKRLGNKQEEYMQAKHERDLVIGKRDAMIKEMEQAIRLYYKERIDKENKKVGDLENSKVDLMKLCENSGKFDAVVLGELLSQIMSFYEGENYTYIEKQFSEMVPYSPKPITYNYALICDDFALNYFSEIDKTEEVLDVVLLPLVAEGHVLVLDKSLKELTEVALLSGNIANQKIEYKISFGRFGYLEEFINAILLYRFCEDPFISDEKLKSLQIAFLKNNRETIEKRYEDLQTKDDEDKLAMTRQRTKHCVMLDEFRKYIK